VISPCLVSLLAVAGKTGTGDGDEPGEREVISVARASGEGT
jgi:hypothetical protein